MTKKINSKKVIALVIAAVLAVQFCSVAVFAGNTPAVRDIKNFRDVSQGDWYYAYVKQLYEDGVINGVTDNLFSPDSAVKTSEVAALIARYLGDEYLAERCREYLIRKNIEGADLWYSGYIQLLCDTGIFGSAEIAGYGIKLTSSGGVVISKNAAAFIESPIKRMDMVKLIAKSFELKKGTAARANRLKNEISGNGNEFINGGGYDYETLDKIRYMISDYSDIPEEYREYFLKCYYNGIVRGNEKSEVLPYNNLKRSELAKIIAAVSYFDLRGEEIRNIPAACVITQSDYSISSVDGSYVLKKEKAERILREQAKNIKISDSKNSVNITVGQRNIIPTGYLNEIYVYGYDGGVYEAGAVNCAANTDAYFPKENSFTISKEGKKSADGFWGYVYLLLRDLNRDGEIAGAVMFNIDSAGQLKDASVYYLP